jgi:L-rhamnose-H+ transport protein
VATGLFLLVSSTIGVGYGNYLKANETPAAVATQ